MTWIGRSAAPRTIVLACAAVGCLVVVRAALPATSTFAGKNGLLVYQAQVGANTQLFTVKPDGSGVTQITHFKGRSATDANWAPGGARIVFTQHWDPGGPNEHFLLSTIDARGGALKTLPKTGSLAVNPNWLTKERIAYLDAVGAHGGTLMVVNADGSGRRSAGVAVPGPFSACALGRGGKIAFLGERPNGGTAIFVAGLFGHGLKRITSWGGYADKIDCSPDGTRIVFSKPEFSQDSGASSNVYTVRTDGSGEVQLTHESDAKTNAGADSWSPDGQKIAYVSNKSGRYQIWTMNADGSDAKQVTHGPEAHLAAWGTHP